MLGAMVAEALAAARPGASVTAAPGASASAASGCAGCELRVLRRAGLPGRWPGLEQPVPDGGWQVAWRAALGWADAVWLVAPETAGELEQLAAEVEAAGVRLLGPSSGAVAVAASKAACHAALAGRVRQPADIHPAHGWVFKPDDGVAAQGVRRLATPVAAAGGIVQPYVPGDALSVCVLSDGSTARVLCVNRQHIEWDASGHACYRGGVANAIADRASFEPLAQAVQGSIPGLWGCWGIDLVLAVDGVLVLIEVNPRLTTAFAHLRAATGFAVLDALLALAGGIAIEDLAQVPPGRPVAFGLAGVEAAT